LPDYFYQLLNSFLIKTLIKMNLNKTSSIQHNGE
jgi:hypothetical protein